MSNDPMSLERRAHQRHRVALPITVHGGQGPVTVTSEDLSLGGLCVRCDNDDELAIGDRVEVDVAIPGLAAPQRVEAEVRWKRSDRAGIQFRQVARGAIAAFVAAFALATPAMASANQTSTVPEFDPNGDVTLDMNGGGERPDDTQVLTAFEQQFDDFDQCVARAKHGQSRQLPGEVNVEVLLNPKGAMPLGINAAVNAEMSRDADLRNCLRSAIAAGPYPAYDGPPIVVEFSFELDPGEDYIEGEA